MEKGLSQRVVEHSLAYLALYEVQLQRPAMEICGEACVVTQRQRKTTCVILSFLCVGRLAGSFELCMQGRAPATLLSPAPSAFKGLAGIFEVRQQLVHRAVDHNHFMIRSNYSICRTSSENPTVVSAMTLTRINQK